jgi:hypothetical protein
MLSWVIQITVISTILIFLVHHLINFFKSTLTVPKIKDLVNTPTQKYENMYNIIKQKSNTYKNEDYTHEDYTHEDYTLIDLLPKKEETTMKSELKNFLKNQLHNSPKDGGTEISSLDSMTMSNSFSSYKND